MAPVPEFRIPNTENFVVENAAVDFLVYSQKTPATTCIQ